MKVLYVTNMYPVKDYTYYGIHVKEQIDSIVSNHKMSSTIYFINGRVTKLSYLLSIIKINWLIYKLKVDVIHIHFGLSGLFLLFNPFLTIPVLLTLHGSDVNTKNTFIKFLVRKVISKSNKTIVMNSQMYDDVKRFAKALEVIPCGVDLNFFRPILKTANESLVLGFCGNPERSEKNYGLFSDIVKQLNGKGFNTEAVIFHNLSRAQVVSKLNYVDVLLLTSFNEGSPQIIKEALACNTPVVSVPVGDVPFVLSGVDNCRIASNYQPDKLIKCILEVTAEKSGFEEDKGRKKLKALNLDHWSVANRIFNCYKELAP